VQVVPDMHNACAGVQLYAQLFELFVHLKSVEGKDCAGGYFE